MISPTLYEALTAYKNDCKEPLSNPVVAFYGLCHYVDTWSLAQDSNTDAAHMLNLELREELRKYTDNLRPDEYFHFNYPFDVSDNAYRNDTNKHLNPKRQAFVDRLIAEYEKEHAA